MNTDFMVYFCGFNAFVVSGFEWWDCLVDAVSRDGQGSECVWMIPTWEAFERAS